MGMTLVIEGTHGARKIRSGQVPRLGEWLSLEINKKWWWLPVIEVGYVFSKEEVLTESVDGCDFAHQSVEPIIFTSLALSVRAEVSSEEETYKRILPPSRWPFGGIHNGEKNKAT